MNNEEEEDSTVKIYFFCIKSFVMWSVNKRFFSFFLFMFFRWEIYERECLKLDSSYGDDKTIKNSERCCETWNSATWADDEI